MSDDRGDAGGDAPADADGEDGAGVDDAPPGGESDIHQLDERTVERIAAGEVVERPASAVKELVENSVDAGASRVEIEIEGDGTDLLRVRDDGVGMTEADVRRAVQEHTTSKIDGIEDLESGVATLGFRGEALHTIGAVSRMTIRTRPRDGGSEADGGSVGDDSMADDPGDGGTAAAGTELVYEGGEVVSIEPCGCPEGTTVEVEDLFFNTPARRKYLKSETTEFARINRVATQYALANPDVAVSLSHDGRETFSTTGRDDLEETVLSVYGRDVAEAMIEVEASWEDGPVRSIRGLVSHPETNRAAREYVSTFLDGRYVTAAPLREPVVEAYGGQLAGDRYPFAVLFLEVPGEAVDVNVHPRKMEARFEREDAVRRRIRETVEAALVEHGLVRSSAPRGRSQAEEADVAPERAGRGSDSVTTSDEATADEATGEGADRTASDEATGATGDTANRSTNDGATGATSDASDGATGATTDTTRSPTDESATETGGDAASADEATANRQSGARSESAGGASGERAGETGSEPADTERRHLVDADEGRTADGPGGERPDDHPPRPRGDHGLAGGGEQATLGGGTVDDAPEFDRLPRLRVLGQFRDTYLVCETDDGLALVDQHAAHERINYERLRGAIGGTAQTLATPVTVGVTAGEAAAFDAYREALERIGFRAERAGNGEDGAAAAGGGDDASGGNDGPGNGSGEAAGGARLRVTAVPAVVDETVDPAALRDALAAAVEDGDPAAPVADLADELLADLACYPSITANTSLREGSVLGLLEALDDCENPYACPHGRPVIVRLDDDEIEARFERDYPGHE